MITEHRKVVKITAEPLSQDENSTKLAAFFHDELEKRQRVKKV